MISDEVVPSIAFSVSYRPNLLVLKPKLFHHCSCCELITEDDLLEHRLTFRARSMVFGKATCPQDQLCPQCRMPVAKHCLTWLGRWLSERSFWYGCGPRTTHLVARFRSKVMPTLDVGRR